jgi:hypothetical protein
MRHACDAGVSGPGEGVHAAYASRIRRLLAPGIAEAILDGRQAAELQLDSLLNGIPLESAVASNAAEGDDF